MNEQQQLHALRRYLKVDSVTIVCEEPLRYHVEYVLEGKLIKGIVERESVRTFFKKECREYFLSELKNALVTHFDVTTVVIDTVSFSAVLQVGEKNVGDVSWFTKKQQWYYHPSTSSAYIKFPVDSCAEGIEKCANIIPF